MSPPERALLDQALVAMAGCVRRLERSHAALEALLPLEPAQLGRLTPRQEEAIDAILKRFEQLVATIQDQMFKSLAIAEAEDIHGLSRRDVTELMERLGAIPSAADFRALAVLRNKLSHLYPDDPARQAANLNAAFAITPALLATARQLAGFATRRKPR
jgi:hypothetical protein